MGAYHSTKNFEIFQTETNGTEISWEKFQKIQNLLTFRKRIIQPKIPEIPKWKSNETENSRQKFPEIRIYLTWLSSFSEFMQIPNFLLSAS